MPLFVWARGQASCKRSFSGMFNHIAFILSWVLHNWIALHSLVTIKFWTWWGWTPNRPKWQNFWTHKKPFWQADSKQLKVHRQSSMTFSMTTCYLESRKLFWIHVTLSIIPKKGLKHREKYHPKLRDAKSSCYFGHDACHVTNNTENGVSFLWDIRMPNYFSKAWFSILGHKKLIYHFLASRETLVGPS